MISNMTYNTPFPKTNRLTYIHTHELKTTLRFLKRCIARFGINLKKVKNTHSGVLLLVKLQALAWNFTKSNTPPRVSFTFFKLCKRYQIAPMHHSDQEQQLTRLLSAKSTAINDWAFWSKTVTNLKFSCLEIDAMHFFFFFLS